jgi:hypothetical protein
MYKYWIFDRAGQLYQTVEFACDAAFDAWNATTEKAPGVPMFFHVFSNNPETRKGMAETLAEAKRHVLMTLYA